MIAIWIVWLALILVILTVGWEMASEKPLPGALTYGLRVDEMSGNK